MVTLRLVASARVNPISEISPVAIARPVVGRDCCTTPSANEAAMVAPGGSSREIVTATTARVASSPRSRPTSAIVRISIGPAASSA